MSSVPLVQKVCTGCGKILPADAFYPRDKHGQSLSSRCKACVILAASGQLTPVSPTLRICRVCCATLPLDRFTGKSHMCRACADFRGRESVQKAQLRYNAAHADERRTRSRARYKNDPRYGPQKQREWRAAHPEQSKAATYRHRATHPTVNARCIANRRARKVGAPGTYTAAEWDAVKAQYGYACLRCGRREPDVTLTADHVEPLSQGGSNDIGNIQPLCQSCNSTKHTRTGDYRIGR